MKRFLISAVFAAATLTSTAFASDIGVSISVGQPGFFGQLNIGDYPQPNVIYSQPVVIDRGISMNRAPIYLRVPPHHYKHWNRYCHNYNACNQRVYFVNDNWYQHEYVPRYQERHQDHRNDRMEDRRDYNHDNDHAQRYDDRRNDRMDDRRNDDRGHGDHH